MKRILVAAVLICAMTGLAGCGDTNPVPSDAVQTYLSDLATGNYTAACGMMTSDAQSALVSAKGGRHGCPYIFRHCLPSDPAALKRDQTQLLFGGTQPYTKGVHARVIIHGTDVARELREVTLERHGLRWFVIDPGRALERCRVDRHRGQRST